MLDHHKKRTYNIKITPKPKVDSKKKQEKVSNKQGFQKELYMKKLKKPKNTSKKLNVRKERLNTQKRLQTL